MVKVGVRGQRLGVRRGRRVPLEIKNKMVEEPRDQNKVFEELDNPRRSSIRIL